MKLRQLKPFVPAPIWIWARRAMVYLRRLRVWQSVLAHIAGVTPREQSILKRSARLAISTSLKQLDSWQDPQLIEAADVDVRSVGRFHVRAFTDDLYHILPTRESAVLNFIEGNLADGDTFVDAGANIGFYTIAAAHRVGAAGRVVAIEMIPETADILRHHVELNGHRNVEVIETALSDRSGETIQAEVPVGKYGQASIVRSKAAATLSAATVAVQTDTLDELFQSEQHPIAIIKLDLEGAEFKALTGATQLLKRTRSVIFEQLGDEREVCELLRRAGFAVRPIDGNNYLAER